jgi:hypothetical protein
MALTVFNGQGVDCESAFTGNRTRDGGIHSAGKKHDAGVFRGFGHGISQARQTVG